MLTAGAVVLLFVVYTLWGTGIQTARAQDELRAELDVEVNVGSESNTDTAQPDDLELGAAYGILRIPRFGDDWEWVIVEGVQEEDLKDGPGHYPHTVDPGEVGNFSIAAQWATRSRPSLQRVVSFMSWTAPLMVIRTATRSR